jgi:coenzyme F420-reducing hydrogenase delta subunit
MAMLRSLLKQFGLNEQRLELAWISAGEAEKFATTMNGFIESITELGPSPYRTSPADTKAAGAAKEAADV